MTRLLVPRLQPMSSTTPSRSGRAWWASTRLTVVSGTGCPAVLARIRALVRPASREACPYSADFRAGSRNGLGSFMPHP